MERRLARLLWHRRGWRVRLLAFTSYGVGGGPPGTGWVRVIGRALLFAAIGLVLTPLLTTASPLGPLSGWSGRTSRSVS